MDLSYLKLDVRDSINKKLSSLSEEELVHARQFLELLFPDEQSTHMMHYMGKFLGIEKYQNSYRMHLGKSNENIHGVAQGGAIYTLADIAIGFHLIEESENELRAFTQELKMNYIKKGKGNYLYAYPKVLHFGHRTIITECSIKDENDELIAHGLGTFFIDRKI